MRTYTLVLALVVAMAPALAHADADTDAEARQHYKAATGHFAVGEFAAAANEYEAAFKLHQDPALLFNAAQARRLAGENQKALVLYKNFLQLYPDSKQAPAVREQIAHLQDVVNAEEKAKNAPPTNTVQPGTEQQQPPPPAQTQQQPPPPQPAQATTPEAAPQTAANEGPRPIYKKWWFWTAIGAGVVVLAVVIPVAVVESQPSWNNLPAQGPGAAGARVPVPSLEVRW